MISSTSLDSARGRRTVGGSAARAPGPPHPRVMRLCMSIKVCQPRGSKRSQVAVEVLEHGDGAVTFLLRFPNKDYALGFERALKSSPEIIHEEEQEHSTAGLISNSRRLLVADSSNEGREPGFR